MDNGLVWAEPDLARLIRVEYDKLMQRGSYEALSCGCRGEQRGWWA